MPTDRYVRDDFVEQGARHLPDHRHLRLGVRHARVDLKREAPLVVRLEGGGPQTRAAEFASTLRASCEASGMNRS